MLPSIGVWPGSPSEVCLHGNSMGRMFPKAWQTHAHAHTHTRTHTHTRRVSFVHIHIRRPDHLPETSEGGWRGWRAQMGILPRHMLDQNLPEGTQAKLTFIYWQATNFGRIKELSQGPQLGNCPPNCGHSRPFLPPLVTAMSLSQGLSAFA